MTKIMIADDEESIRTLIGRIVNDLGFEYCSACDGTEALQVWLEEQPDLLILDVMMPRLNGFQVCERLRSQGALLPIIFLSAKGDIVDKGIGFNAGGDDYLVKPFSSEELSLRISAHLRKSIRDTSLPRNLFSIGPFTFNLRKHQVLVSGAMVDLTPKEFQILVLLASHPGEVFTRRQLVEAVWGSEYVEGTTSIAVFIRKIREKVESDPSKPRFVQTVWRVGYRFSE